MPLFHPRIIEKYTKFAKALPLKHVEILSAWAENLSNGVFNRETSHDSEFIQQILIDVLGYKGSNSGHLCTVGKNLPVGNGNVDTALGRYAGDEFHIVAPFELKGAKTRDLDAIMPGRNKSPVQQAWEYGMDAKGAKWVLVSNYREIRLYAIGYGRKDYEVFDLSKLADPFAYARFMLLLSAPNLLGEGTANLLIESESRNKEITDNFYKDYKALRARMIDTLAKDNPAISALEIIQHTQTILDRVLFVSFAAGRGLLPKGTLKSCYEDRGKWKPQPAWENFKGLFNSIDTGNPPLDIPGYNGGLFAPNATLDKLTVSDAICEGFKAIGEYDFESDVSVNILGHIFEQSIADLEEIKANASGNADALDSKKSKRKKDGIFYTPSYITRYIVEQAVGGWLNDRKNEIGFAELPELTDTDYGSIQSITRGERKGTVTYNKRIERHIKAWEGYKEALSHIKVLDPACGSGAFLNEVFDYLYREGQIVNSELATLNAGQAKLFRWDKHILANNIYGVDINQESVEITKLSLWLKTANRKEKLTYLDDNVKCGNSLIDDSSIADDLAFKWEDEFPDIMKAGGFDVVVGNPPWGANFITAERDYFKRAYSDAHMRTPESFNYFIYRSECLSRGYVGLIVPSSYLMQHEFSKSRQYLAINTTLQKVINLGDGVFEDVATPSCIICWKVKAANDSHGYYGDYRKVSRQALNYKLFEKSNLLPISDGSFTVSGSKSILDKCLAYTPLKKVVANIATGISSGLDKAFIYEHDAVLSLHLETEILRKLVLGGELNRYLMTPESRKQIAYLTSEDDLNLYPNVKKAILPYKEALSKRREAANGKIPWFSLHWPRRKEVFEQPKIIIRQTASSLMASFDDAGWYCLKSAIMVQLPTNSNVSYLYLLALLNSRLMDFIYQDFVGEKARIFPEVKPVQLFKLPIREASVEQQKPVIKEVEVLLAKNREFHDLLSKFLALLQTEFGLEKANNKLEKWYLMDFADFKTELEKKKIHLSLSQKAEWMTYFKHQKNQALALKAIIDQTDREIDQMVYALYGLTSDEVATIEAS